MRYTYWAIPQVIICVASSNITFTAKGMLQRWLGIWHLSENLKILFFSFLQPPLSNVPPAAFEFAYKLSPRRRRKGRMAWHNPYPYLGPRWPLYPCINIYVSPCIDIYVIHSWQWWRFSWPHHNCCPKPDIHGKTCFSSFHENVFHPVLHEASFKKKRKVPTEKD